MSQKIILICSECMSRNYVVSKTNNMKTRMEVKKFCPKCKKHTIHKETR